MKMVLFCLLVFGILSISKVASSSNITITSPRFITALNNDVTVRVGGVSGGEVVKVYYEDERFPLTGQIVSVSNDKGDGDVTLVFDCGYFSRLGNYSFVASKGTEKPESSSTSSANNWTNTSIQLPRHHEAYTGDVMVTITSSDDVCRSSVTSQYTTKLILMRDDVVVMATSDVTFPPTAFFFECDVFSHSGNYVVQLQMSTNGNDSIIQQSDVMRVDRSGEYSLTVPEVISPCAGETIKVLVGKPPCAPLNDVIQAIAMFNNGGYYVIKNVTAGNSDSVEFLCSNLLTSSPGVCFRYVTSHAAFRTVCRSRNRDEVFSVDGDWSVWSYWTTCSRKCSDPIRQRVRSCDNPKQRGQGSSCSSEDSHFQYHSVAKQAHGDVIACPYDATKLTNASLRCLCGCSLLALERGILLSPVSGECGGMTALEWRLYAPLNYVIRFRLLDFQLQLGETLLIIDTSSSTTMTVQTSMVTSKQSIVTVRYVRSLRSDVIMSCGFVIYYEPVELASSYSTTSLDGGKEPTTRNGTWFDDVVSNPVVVVAIGGCLIVVVIVFTVAILRCKKQRRKDYESKRHGMISLENRLKAPPDGKSSSNLDTESECRTLFYPNDVTVTPRPPRAAYYLAQRQLQLMKKEGKENSSQTYTSLCLTDHNIHEQEALMFGHLPNEAETIT